MVVILRSDVPAAASPAHSPPFGEKVSTSVALVVGHVDAEAGVHEQVAVLLLQEIGFRLELAAADRYDGTTVTLLGFAPPCR